MPNSTRALIAAAYAVGLLFAPAVGWAQVLWNGASVGMTPAEVTAVFPQAGQGEREGTDDRMSLRVNNLRAAGHDASAVFDFEQNRLTRVQLILIPGTSGTSISPDDIRGDLTSKYGAPINCYQTNARCEWRAGDIDIELDDASSTNGIDIVYRRPPEGSDAPARNPAAAGPLTLNEPPG